MLRVDEGVDVISEFAEPFGGCGLRIAVYRPVDDFLRHSLVELARCALGDDDARIASRAELLRECLISDATLGVRTADGEQLASGRHQAWSDRVDDFEVRISAVIASPKTDFIGDSADKSEPTQSAKIGASNLDVDAVAQA